MPTHRLGVHHLCRSRLGRSLAIVQTVAQLGLGVPAWAQDTGRPGRRTPPPAPKVTVNRTVPAVTLPPLRPVFSDPPTDAEVTRARVFAEPLVPIGRATTPEENRALAEAVLAYGRRGAPGAVDPLEQVLARFPDSPWRASLLASLGDRYRQEGRLGRALRTWEAAWDLAREASEPAARATADRAVSQWLGLSAELGHVAAVDRRLGEVVGRAIGGPSAQRVARAREVRRLFEQHPESVRASAVEALTALRPSQDQAAAPASALAQYRPTAAGTSLARARALAREAGRPLQAARRTGAGTLPTPAVVHWRVNHYVAVLAARGDAYLVRDGLAGGDRWMARAAIEEEMSGYALVAEGPLPDGWQAVTEAEAAAVVGFSCEPGPPDDRDPCTDPCCGAGPGGAPGGPSDSGGSNGSSGCAGGGCRAPSPGMPTYRFHPVTASLWLWDTPVGYTPPLGPGVSFTVAYHQRDDTQPQVFTYANLGPNWRFTWQASVVEGVSDQAEVSLPTGGTEFYRTANGAGEFPRSPRSGAQLVRTSASPLQFERRLADGSVEVYGQPDGAAPGWRRVFLTAIRDARGQAITFTWDAQWRLVAVTDALGQVTTLGYAHPTDPLKITTVTDPFARSATFTYTAAGQLASLTDVLGLTSRVTYGADDFITSLTTPYGTTTFRHEPDALQTYFLRSIEATDPLGGTTRQEFRWSSTDVPASVPASEVPTGFAASNTYLDHFLTFAWDERAMATAPGAAASAVVTKWLVSDWWGPAGANPLSVAIPHSVKRPLEGRVWYAYPNQTDPNETGSGSQPSRVGRVLDNGTSQVTETTYNDHRMVTSSTDPVGRQTTYTYAANGIDLLEVRQITSGGSDLLAQYGTYSPQHLPASVTDGAGRTTTFTYNAAGQVLTATNAKSETTTYVYDTAGYVQSVTGPATGATTTYTYDGYGRVRTVTGPDGYGVTTDYDALDRPTLVTYPDGTTEQTGYDKLDVSQRRDRQGRVTWFFHDALRRQVATRDPAGRTVTHGWLLGSGGCSGCAGRDTLVDAKGQATTWERDLQGRVLREVRADGVTATVYSYEAVSGRLHTVTDPKQQVTTYTYNLDGTVQQVAYTNAQIATPSVSYTYDPVYSRVATMVDGTGTTSYTYHPAGSLGAGQVASVDGPLTNDTITYTYDELGRVVTRAINGAANTTTQVYDALGRVTSETNVLGTFTYAYVGVTGRLQLVTYPNGQTSSYAYFDTVGDLRLQTIHHRKPDTSTLSKFDYTYDSVGNILTWQQQADSDAPTVWQYGYDRADQLTAAMHQTTGGTPTILKRYAYTYDPAGNRTAEQIDDAVTLATHDNLNRLLTHQAGGTLQFKGTLSEPGTVMVNGKPAPVDATNRFQLGVPVAAGTTTVTINATDASGNAAEAVYEVDQAGTSKTFTYDANGNMTSDATRTFEWDARNQLVAVNVGTHRSEFTYDGLQRRVREVQKENGGLESDSKVLWCDRQICEERATDGTSVLRRASPLGEQVAGASRYFAADHLGSVREVIDDAGTLVSRYAFDAWGRRSQSSGGPVIPEAFTGHRESRPASLLLTLYRAYDLDLGRWLSEDPIGMRGGYDLYAYVSGRPTILTDPLGLQCCSKVEQRRRRVHDILDTLERGEQPQGLPGTLPPAQSTCSGGEATIYIEDWADPCLRGCYLAHERRHARQCRRLPPEYLGTTAAERSAYMEELGCLISKARRDGCGCPQR